jgi:hypothetical protein
MATAYLRRDPLTVAWPGYPERCANGHEWGPGLITVSWSMCDCPPAVAAQERAGAARPGADNRSDEFPELCHCDRRRGRGHVNCKASGPYCPGCATRVQEFWLEQRELYRD